MLKHKRFILIGGAVLALMTLSALTVAAFAQAEVEHAVADPAPDLVLELPGGQIAAPATLDAARQDQPDGRPARRFIRERLRENLADALGVTPEQLDEARWTAYLATLEDAVEEGVLSQQAADRMVAQAVIRRTAGREEIIAAGLGIDLVEVVEHGKDLDNTAMLKRFQSKGVQYVISQTVQPPVATMLKSAQSLGMIAATYGEAGKITFLGAHYAGGPDLVGLAGSAANGYYWTTSYKLMTAKGPGTDSQFALAKRYGRDEKLANSQNYTNGIMVAQVAVEAMRRAKSKGKEVTRATLYEEMLAMNGYNAYYPLTTVGPVSFSKTDREGVDTLQLYVCKDGVFYGMGAPFVSEYVQKIKQ